MNAQRTTVDTRHAVYHAHQVKQFFSPFGKGGRGDFPRMAYVSQMGGCALEVTSVKVAGVTVATGITFLCPSNPP